MSEILKILFIPLDDRPVSYTLPHQIASINNKINFFEPPREFLGGLTNYSDVDKILQWLDDTLKTEKIDYIIVSLDTIAYGGLIPSRRSNDSAVKILDRLDAFRKIIESSQSVIVRSEATKQSKEHLDCFVWVDTPPRNDNSPKIYGFSSIMRISDSYVNEEEKEYWDRHGKEIFKYSYLTHKENKEPDELKKRIPHEILEDYLQTRDRNFSINRFYLSWLEENFLDFLVFSKDDTGQFGLNVQEAETLNLEIQQNEGSDKAVILTGADEIPSDLISRAIVDYFDVKISIFPVFSTENGGNIISRYEDKTIQEAVQAQINLCGAEIADSKEYADMYLLVNTPEKIQNDHCLKIYLEMDNKNAVDFCIDFIQNSYKPVIIADISSANGADNLLVTRLLENFSTCHCEEGQSSDEAIQNTTSSWIATSPFFLDTQSKKRVPSLVARNDKVDYISKIYGYAGWNTTGNTLGSVISTGISRFIAEKTNNIDLKNFKKAILVRFADDWGYQTIIRQKLREASDSADIKALKENLIPLALKIASIFDYELVRDELSVSFPWNRTFEVEVSV